MPTPAPSHSPSPLPSRSSTPSNPKSKSSTPPQSQSASSYLSYPVTHVVSGLYRRLTEPSTQQKRPPLDPMSSTSTYPQPQPRPRAPSPFFQPPPLTPLTLKTPGNPSNLLLTRNLAEEIRLLVPPRLQLLDTWQLVYSLDRDGSSLATLYENCKAYAGRRAGYVLVVKDAGGENSHTGGGGGIGGGGGSRGAIFGAYLTDAPHPASHYYGTGECFLWRASVLPSTPLVQARSTAAADNENMKRTGLHDENANANGNGDNGNENTNDLLELAGLPLPPSADTTQLRGRSTTLRGEDGADITTSTIASEGDTGYSGGRGNDDFLSPTGRFGQRSTSRTAANSDRATTGASRHGSGTTTPERIRFKAFPYSGVNDYMILCETGFLSVGGG
ncbi:oxidation resistance protein 1 [Onygenales sp. PD_12]|nr:oxidation resistance protein 1 [Onygenales sp. PD_12]KAK2784398.1 oxidation resistance protein 1 [Emmonsiellopsis sp. PD_33]